MHNQNEKGMAIEESNEKKTGTLETSHKEAGLGDRKKPKQKMNDILGSNSQECLRIRSKKGNQTMLISCMSRIMANVGGQLKPVTGK